MMSLVLAEQNRNLHLYLIRVSPIEQEVHKTYLLRMSTVKLWEFLTVVYVGIGGCRLVRPIPICCHFVS